ncbi:hypothetical protein ACODUO_06420 [Stenotrophomonas maltophilia]
MHWVETMAYAGEKPWHGLGNRLVPRQSIEVWKRQAGMDWKALSGQVMVEVGGQVIGFRNTNCSSNHKLSVLGNL